MWYSEAHTIHYMGMALCHSVEINMGGAILLTLSDLHVIFFVLSR